MTERRILRGYELGEIASADAAAAMSIARHIEAASASTRVCYAAPEGQ